MNKSLNLEKLDHYNEMINLRREERVNETASMTQVELRYLEEEEEEMSEKMNANLLFDHLREIPENFYIFTGFYVNDFIQLYSIVENSMEKPKRGRKPKFTSMDQFLIFIHYLRTYPKVEMMKPIFNLDPSTFQNIINKIIDNVCPKLIEVLITQPAEEDPLLSNDDFEKCAFVVDATVQQICQPDLDWDICKAFYSGKHDMYCLKSQVIVNFQGLALHVVSGVRGSVHDKEVFDENIDEFIENVISHHSGQPTGIIGDKGYQDSSCELLTTPIKGNVSELDSQQLQFNQKIKNTRIIVENYFGRLKSRYQIIGEKYRGAHGRYDMIFKTCCALVNFEIINGSPLRSSDRDYFLRHKAALRKKINQKRQEARSKADAQKQRRMEHQMRLLEDSDDY